MDDNTNKIPLSSDKGDNAGKPPKIRLSPPNKTNSTLPKPKIKLTSVPMETVPDAPKEDAKDKPKIKLVSSTQETTPPASSPPKIKLASKTIKKTPETVTVPPLDTASPAKSTTTRIAAAKPKTIKIKRPSSAVLSSSSMSDAKKETSRVDVSEALAETAQKAPPPKTIKLKRPGASVLTPVPKLTPAVEDAPKEVIASAKKSETSRIQLPPEAMVEAPTVRKTVQIKRTGTGGGAAPKKTFTLAKPSTDTSLDDDPFMPEINIEPEEKTVVFSLVSLVAAIVVCVLIYVLAAQTIMPNLPWPGKM